MASTLTPAAVMSRAPILVGTPVITNAPTMIEDESPAGA